MIYKSKVVDLGKEVESFRNANMIVLFNKNVPSELKNYCVIHENEIMIEEDVKENYKFFINETEYKITAVGNMANENFMNLGHVTLVFDGKNEAKMPGNIHLEGSFQIPNIDDYIIITRG